MIRIIGIPPGEAPESVRKAWVGLVLPVAGPLRKYPIGGVLSSPKSVLGELFFWFTGRYKREAGYMVDAQAAVSILAKVNPEAAEWWRVNTPRILKEGRHFLFQAPVCQEEPFDAD